MDIQVKNKIEEFFFDLRKNTASYRDSYKSNHPDEPIRFSPLYLICRDIHYCFGKNPELGILINTGSDFGPAKFAGVILLSSAIHMLSSIMVVREDKIGEFSKKYLKLSKKDGNRLELLRNSIVHINYSIAFKRRGKPSVLFTLSEIQESLIFKGENIHGFAEHYIINPVIFKKRFLNTLAPFKKDLMEDVALRESFDRKVNNKEWLSILN